MLGSNYPVVQSHVPAEQRILSYIAIKTSELKLAYLPCTIFSLQEHADAEPVFFTCVIIR
jgi:hypothetical protein